MSRVYTILVNNLDMAWSKIEINYTYPIFWKYHILT